MFSRSLRAVPNADLSKIGSRCFSSTRVCRCCVAVTRFGSIPENGEHSNERTDQSCVLLCNQNLLIVLDRRKRIVEMMQQTPPLLVLR